MTPTASTPLATATQAATDTAGEPLLAEDLIEEVSIDGMCGVY